MNVVVNTLVRFDKKMSAIYDNWERLVRATLLREELKLIGQMTPSDISSPFSSSISSSPEVLSFNLGELCLEETTSFFDSHDTSSTDHLNSRQGSEAKNNIKHLPNGDMYIGNFLKAVPHGSGKYLWIDGCMYEGEWKRGMASGKGKFSWPAGATFEGEFNRGRMEGIGTFIGPDGDVYKGSWSADQKHGYGVKHYTNGDYYEGCWKRNLQDEQGRYVWRNGNEYIGEWKNGAINGRGVLGWANGNKYDGTWENGVPKGHGVFTWADGSCYIGCWTKDSKTKGNQILNGSFLPTHENIANSSNYSNENTTFQFTN